VLNVDGLVPAGQPFPLTETDQLSSLSPVAFNHLSKETTARILRTLTAVRSLYKLQLPGLGQCCRPLVQVFIRVTQLTSHAIARILSPDRQQGWPVGYEETGKASYGVVRASYHTQWASDKVVRQVGANNSRVHTNTSSLYQPLHTISLPT
jgi:hypothetical protein